MMCYTTFLLFIIWETNIYTNLGKTKKVIMGISIDKDKKNILFDIKRKKNATDFEISGSHEANALNKLVCKKNHIGQK